MNVYDHFEDEKFAIQQMREDFKVQFRDVSLYSLTNQDFYEVFDKGLKYYLNGQWDLARDVLESVEGLTGQQDSPTMSLLLVMEQENYEAPQNWKGYREQSF